MPWISVPNWRKFQHYDPSKRRPVWVKTYLDLLSTEGYRDLSAGCRAALHGIWLEYASTQCQLKFDAKSLSSRLNLRVTKQHLDTLVSAGFLDVVASTSLADGYQSASARTRSREEEKEKEKEPKAVALDVDAEHAATNGPGFDQDDEQDDAEPLALIQALVDETATTFRSP